MNSALQMEQTRIKDLEIQINGLMRQNTGMAEQREIQQLQLKTFEEDFDLLKQERQQKIQQLEKNISEHQLTIRRISNEVCIILLKYQNFDLKGRSLYKAECRVSWPVKLKTKVYLIKWLCLFNNISHNISRMFLFNLKCLIKCSDLVVHVFPFYRDSVTNYYFWYLF